MQYNCFTNTYQIDYAKQGAQNQYYRDSQLQNMKYFDGLRENQERRQAEENYRLGINLTDAQRIQRDKEIKENEEKKKKQQEYDIWSYESTLAFQKRELERKCIKDAQNRERIKQENIIRIQQEQEKIKQQQEQEKIKLLQEQEKIRLKQEQEKIKLEQKQEKNRLKQEQCAKIQEKKNTNASLESDSKTNECCSTCNIL